MTGQPRGLGRGLGALIPPGSISTSKDSASPQQSGLLEVPVTDIVPNPRQPRTRMDPESLNELAASIKEHGLIQPLIVTEAPPTSPARYQLIAGERRWRASQLAGLRTVPVVVKDASPRQHLELALVENLQRADLNPLEEAEAYHALISDFSLSQQEVAERVGKSRVAVANTLRLLRLPERVKALLASGALMEGHARAILSLGSEDAATAAAGQIIARGLSVRQAEELVRRLVAAAELPPADEPPTDDPNVYQTRRLEDAFRSALGTKVALTRGRKGGKLVISFFSDEELQSIYEHIVGSE
jgi:ParB family transcriptional regulator, chromosome partitioning protein